jgi:tetratricopeptide (TPR) repeat protein
MRDAAYDGMPKAERAKLHERFADWLTERAAELVELDELVGYHLEQALHYRRELGQSDERGLAVRAGERLRAAAKTAVSREDFRAALNLLQRSATLLPDERRDARFEIELGYARFTAGRPEEVLSGLAVAAERAAAAGRRRDELVLRLDHAGYTAVYEPTANAATRLRELIDESMPVLEEAGDEFALAVAWSSRLLLEQFQHSGAAVVAAERVIEHARRADSRLYADWATTQLVHTHYGGATPVEECLLWLDEHPDVERRHVLPYRDRLLAMLGRFDEANELLAQGADRLAERGLGATFWVSLAWRRIEVAMLAGDAASAEAAARSGCETALESGDLSNFMWLCAMLGHALIALGRDEEAEEWLARGLVTAPSDEPMVQLLWRQARGKVLARRGELEEGERLAREAVALGAQTDLLNAHADALLDLAEVLELAGRDPRPELEHALALYERKGNLVMAERTRSRLAPTRAGR